MSPKYGPQVHLDQTRAYLKKKQYQEAKDEIQRIQNPAYTADALIELGQALMLEGDRTAALDILPEACALIASSGKSHQCQTDRLALLQAWAGLFADAVRTADLIPEEYGRTGEGPLPRLRLLRAIAVMQWIMGDRTGAFATVAHALNPFYQSEPYMPYLKELGQVVAAPRSLLKQYDHLNDLTGGRIGTDLEAHVRAQDLMADWESLAMQCARWDPDDRARTIAQVRLDSGDHAGAWEMAKSLSDGETKQAIFAAIALAILRFDELPAKFRRLRWRGEQTEDMASFVAKWEPGACWMPPAEDIIKSLREGGGDDAILVDIVRNRLEAEDDYGAFLAASRMRDGDLKDSLVAATVFRHVHGQTPNFPMAWLFVGHIKTASIKVRIIDFLACTMADWKYYHYYRKALEPLEFAHSVGGLSKKGLETLEIVRKLIEQEKRASPPNSGEGVS